jgi:hypothetical protein
MFEYPKYDIFGNEKRKPCNTKISDIVFESGRESRRRIRKENRKKHKP